jgi:hypothetical protein
MNYYFQEFPFIPMRTKYGRHPGVLAEGKEREERDNYLFHEFHLSVKIGVRLPLSRNLRAHGLVAVLLD